MGLWEEIIFVSQKRKKKKKGNEFRKRVRVKLENKFTR